MSDTPFILPQGDFSHFNTLADANAAIRFKTEGLEIYIISEDKFYYWNDNAWVQQIVTGGTVEAAYHTLKVSKSPGTGEFSSIKTAVESIVGNSTANPFVVKVDPGIYVEDTITMAPGISIIANTLGSVIVTPTVNTNTIFIGADGSSITNLILSGAYGTGGKVVYHEGAGGTGFLIKDCNFNSNDIAVHCFGATSPSYVYVDRCSITGNNTYGILIDNQVNVISQIIFTNCTYKDITAPVTAGFVKVTGVNTFCTMTNTTLRALSTEPSIAFQIEDGAEVNLLSVNINGFSKGIYMPNVGAATKISAIGVNFQNNVLNVVVEHTGASGNISANHEITKLAIDYTSLVLIENKDPRLVTVAKVGGDFNSIKAACDWVASRTGNDAPSSTNPYLISVGAGIYTEDEITVSSYISIKGSSIGTTIVEPAGNHNVFTLRNSMVDISFLTIRNAPFGFSGIDIYNTGDFTLTHKVSFYDCDTSIKVVGDTDTTFYGEYIDFNGSYKYGAYIQSIGGAKVFVNLENYYNLPNDTGEPIGTYITGLGAECHVVTSGNIGKGFGTGFWIEDGGYLQTGATYSNFWNYGLYAANVGEPPQMHSPVFVATNNSSYDLFIEHSGTYGSIHGIFNTDKITITPPAPISIVYQDSDLGTFTITGGLNLKFYEGTTTDLSTLITAGATMGLISGGTISQGITSPFFVAVATGVGYLEIPGDPDVYKKITWKDVELEVPLSSVSYIFFTNTGDLVYDSALPDITGNILVGRVVTSDAGIEIFDQSPSDAEHHGNRVSLFFRKGLGAVYGSGSIVSKGTGLTINVTNGEYFFDTTKFSPTGGTSVPLYLYHLDNLGNWVITQDTAVPKTYYTGGYENIVTGVEAVKHSLYIVGEGANEKYLLVWAQERFTSQLNAELGNLPTPPPSFEDGVVLIASLIVVAGSSAVTEIIDSRPVIGFRTPAINAAADHGSLSGLSDNDHNQYLLRAGGNVMVNNLDMGSNGIVNVTTINGTALSEWLTRSGNTYGADTIIGLTDAYALKIRTNNLDRIVISAAGTITLPHLANTTTRVIGATSTGLLTDSVSTTNLAEGTNLYYTDVRVRATVLTGFTSGAGSVSASDTVLSAINKLDGNIGTKQTSSTNLTSLSGLSYVSTSFVKMTATGTFALDTNTYLTSAVTSVSAGTGMSFSTITSTGSVAIDTTKVPYLSGGFSTGLLKWNGSAWTFDLSTYLTSVGTGVANELTYWSGTNTLGSLTTATYPSLTELSYVKGVTSSIQTQLGNKQASSTILSSIAALANAAGWLHNDGAGTFSYSTPTKSDVGLSAVENTALSTWAGTSNIITLGTVTTGVWSASTIAVNKGGTGITTTTAYGVLCGGTTATGSFQNAGAGTLGQVLTSNGPSALPSFQNNANPATIYFSSAANLGTTANSTVFLVVDGVSAPSATDSIAVGTRVTVPVTGTISNLYVNLSTAPGANGRTFTVFINGVASALTCNVTSSTSGSDTSHSVGVTAGSTLSVAITNGAGAPVQSDGVAISFLLG